MKLALILLGITLGLILADIADAEPRQYLFCETIANKLVIGIRPTCPADPRKLHRVIKKMGLKVKKCWRIEK